MSVYVFTMLDSCVETLFEKAGLKIVISLTQAQGLVSAECYFSNGNAAAISNLVFQLAVPVVRFFTDLILANLILVEHETSNGGPIQHRPSTKERQLGHAVF